MIKAQFCESSGTFFEVIAPPILFTLNEIGAWLVELCAKSEVQADCRINDFTIIKADGIGYDVFMMSAPCRVLHQARIDDEKIRAEAASNRDCSIMTSTFKSEAMESNV